MCAPLARPHPGPRSPGAETLQERSAEDKDLVEPGRIVGMGPTRLVTRRTFLADLGRGGMVVAVVSMAGSARTFAQSSVPGSPIPSAGPSADGSPAPSGRAGLFAWHRVDLGFVSAYLLVRGGEAAVVDTGVPGSEGAIAEGLAAAGLDWDAVGHLILTHRHQDHAGSADAVLTAAPLATGYAGTADIPGISVSRPLSAVADGDRVFDLRIVATPGHTAGHIAVLDEAGGVLVAGDALRTEGGAPAAPSAEFTEDMDTALASEAKLAALPFETLLVGHGDPIEGGASAAVGALVQP
jgi:glyoxylase-like metal-dependent hydrolase (beta-lactamase superfamily II)